MRVVLTTRQLGAGGPPVTAIGLGCMSMSWAYYHGVRDDAESERVIRAALDAGVLHLDTASMYGPFTNEALVGRALAHGRPDGLVVASKAGLVVDDPVERKIRRDARPETLRAMCDDSLRRLGVDCLDLYYLHRVDPQVPVAESWGALAELVEEGKIRRLGISECTVDELAEVHAIHPVAALQSEFSLWTREPLDDVVPWCRRHGVAFVAFGVVGRGFLAGAFAPDQEWRRDDFRSGNPRFQPDAMRANLAIVEGLRAIGARVDATPAQLSIAWVLAQGDHILAIPGTKTRSFLAEDLGADRLVLDAETLGELDALPPAVGTRY